MTTVFLRAWGELACFARPEMKVERVSYPVITPSAARGLGVGVAPVVRDDQFHGAPTELF